MYTGDAINDILGNDMFIGNIESIRFIVDFVDGIFTKYITFIAFLIISLALLRNVLTGLYCTFPALFRAMSSRKQELNSKGGGLSFFFKGLALFIPDIENLVISEKDRSKNINASHYFTKALWEGTVAVIVGTMIYNGHYRELIAIGSRFSSHIIENYILVVDYNAAFDKAVKQGKHFEFSYDTKTVGGKEKSSLSTAVYNAVLNYYKGDIIDTETRAMVGAKVQDIVQTQLKNIEVSGVNNADTFWSLMGHDEFNISHKVTTTPQSPSFVEDGVSDPTWIIRQFAFPISDIGVSTPAIPETHYYINVMLYAKHKNIKVSNALTTVDVKGVVFEERSASGAGGQTVVLLPKGVKASTAMLYLDKIRLKPDGYEGEWQRFTAPLEAYAALTANNGLFIKHSEVRYNTALVKEIHISNGTQPAEDSIKISGEQGSWTNEIPRESLRLDNINKDQKFDASGVVDPNAIIRTGEDSGSEIPAGDEPSIDELFEDETFVE